jgi:hypothetical protein
LFENVYGLMPSTQNSLNIAVTLKLMSSQPKQWDGVYLFLVFQNLGLRGELQQSGLDEVT